MLSAWDVYWVMQLDSIGCFLAILMFASGAAVFVTLLFGGMACDFGDVGKKNSHKWKRLQVWSGRIAVAGIVCGLLSAFLPSTKTAAAMIVVPAIANNETLHREAGELYGLAKSALKEAVSGDEAKPKN